MSEDQENPVWTREMMERAVPFRQRHPKLDPSTITVVEVPDDEELSSVPVSSREGVQLKEQITLELSGDVAAALLATGSDRNALAEEILRAGLHRRKLITRTAA